jgi:uncharacterized membrane protein YedE/YeeE
MTVRLVDTPEQRAYYRGLTGERSITATLLGIVALILTYAAVASMLPHAGAGG